MTLFEGRIDDARVGHAVRGTLRSSTFPAHRCEIGAREVASLLMQTYLVGGAVRDALLGKEVHERDWVVVGGTPQLMIDAGYRQVGRDFPVFLHPSTGEEYALARTERKTGSGHTGFECYAAEDVTLEQDLLRRDLTINAIAEDAEGTIADPFGGRADLEARLLRHVSDAFVEDPLRVFRVARFAAVFPEFRVADETNALMTSMAQSGDLDELSAERVWVEWRKALNAQAPGRFLEVLDSAGAIEPWFHGVEVDAMVTLYKTTPFTSAEAANGALGWVHGPAVVRDLMGRLKAPKRFARSVEQLAEHRGALSEPRAVGAEVLLAALASIGALRTSEVTAIVLETVEACTGRSARPLRGLIDQLREVRPNTDATGAQFGALLRAARLELLRDALGG